MVAADKKTQAKSDDPFAQFEAVDPAAVMAGPGRMAAPKVDPIIAKRQKMIDGMNVQIKMFEDPEWMMTRTVYRAVEGQDQRKGYEEKYRPRTQFVETRDGKWLVIPRYGVKVFKIAEDKEAFLLTKEQVVPFFKTVIEVVESGAYDDQLAELSQRRKKTG
jgi:hypothetical protein